MLKAFITTGAYKIVKRVNYRMIALNSKTIGQDLTKQRDGSRSNS
jgi:hypothetical protein